MQSCIGSSTEGHAGVGGEMNHDIGSRRDATRDRGVANVGLDEFHGERAPIGPSHFGVVRGVELAKSRSVQRRFLARSRRDVVDDAENGVSVCEARQQQIPADETAAPGDQPVACLAPPHARQDAIDNDAIAVRASPDRAFGDDVVGHQMRLQPKLAAARDAPGCSNAPPAPCAGCR